MKQKLDAGRLSETFTTGMFSPKKRLATLLEKRDNNFTPIRLLLAFAVLFGHSFPIVGAGSDPISTLFLFPRTWLGQVAVAIFFAISGLLVTASFQANGIFRYAIKRILRIWPAIFVYSLVTTFILGPLITNLSAQEYWSSDFFRILGNSFLVQWDQNLPGAFTDRPFPGATNGSGWTIPVEVRAYAMIGVLGVLSLLKVRGTANLTLIIIWWVNNFAHANLPLFGYIDRSQEPVTYFVVGALFFINRHLIQVTWPMGLVVLIGTSLLRDSYLFTFVLPISVTYCLVLLALRTPSLKLDKFGDISYGVYLWAWPIQQVVYWQFQSPYVNAALSTLIVVPLATLSWFLVERPAIRFGSRLARKMQDLNTDKPTAP